MEKLKKIYKENIYGIMGTLIFHIVLVGSFLLSEIKIKDKVSEESIIIDFTNHKEEIPDIPEEQNREREHENAPSNDLAQRNPSARSNRAVNDAPSKNAASSNDPFFDEAYQKEIADAQKLVADVNAQLEKKIADIKQFEMPEVTTEGINPDSIKNTVYSGESNIHYYLPNRHHARLPIPVYLAQGGGKITVNIWVSPSGKVTKAEVEPSTQFDDPMLPEYAQQAALRTVFNTDNSAPAPQKGTITYTFVPQ